MSIVDVFDVITHARPYKQAMGIDVALDAIQEEKGKQFDPTLVQAFLDLQPTRGLSELSFAVRETVEETQPEPSNR